MAPPFNINQSSPAPSNLISAFPADEQSNRATIEEWLTFISDPATGIIRESALPPAGPSGDIPAGTKMLFVQTAAPTGWTKDTTHNNKALRIVNGTASEGGTKAFTTVFAAGASVSAVSLTTAQLPSHTHTGPSHTHTFSATTGTESADHTHSWGGTFGTSANGDHQHSVQNTWSRSAGGSGGSGANNSSSSDPVTSVAGNHSHTVSVGGSTGGRSAAHTHSVSGTTGSAGTGDTGSTGTGATHTHTMDLDVFYVDVIIATKN